MDNPLMILDKIGNQSISDLMKKPGTKVIVETKENSQSLTITLKEKDYSFLGKIEQYSDGTKTQSSTTSPTIKAASKRDTIMEKQAQGKTQKQIAEEIGLSQATVSRILKG